MISIESFAEPDSQWNDRLKNSKMGTIYQTTENSEYQKIVSNWNHDFMIELDISNDCNKK